MTYSACHIVSNKAMRQGPPLAGGGESQNIRFLPGVVVLSICLSPSKG